MKHVLALCATCSVFCASCISGPHYKLEPAAPFRTERTGRPMLATPGLAELPETAWYDETASCLSFDWIHFLWTPVCSAAMAVATPIYDILCLPRDLYLRSFAGLNVLVADADGTPLEGVRVEVEEKIRNRWEPCSSSFETGPDGVAYIPRKAEFVRVTGVGTSLDEKGYSGVLSAVVATDGSKSEDLGPCVRIFALRKGVSYAPVAGEIDESMVLVPGFKLFVNAALGLIVPSGNNPFPFVFSHRNDYNSIRFMVGNGNRSGPVVHARCIPAMENPTVVKGADFQDGWSRGFAMDNDFPALGMLREDAERRERWIARRRAYLEDHPESSDRTLQWRGRFPSRMRQGLPPGEWILFRIGDRYGLVTEYYVEYGGELGHPVLHLKWLFNLEPGKDWFDMEGLPVVLP